MGCVCLVCEQNGNARSRVGTQRTLAISCTKKLSTLKSCAVVRLGSGFRMLYFLLSVSVRVEIPQKLESGRNPVGSGQTSKKRNAQAKRGTCIYVFETEYFSSCWNQLLVGEVVVAVRKGL